MENETLLLELRELEIELHQPSTRTNKARLGELLHQSFIEFGRSGKVYSRAAIMEELSDCDEAFRVWSQDYQLQLCSSDMALLLYKSAHINDDNELHRFSLRSSLWKFEADRWQMVFHQGTPAQEFVRAKN